MTPLAASVLGLSVWGPGLEGWQASRPILAGETSYEPRPSPAPAPSILPPNERRRTGPVTRLALTVAQEAANASGLAPGALRSVFGSGNGDGTTVGSILDALARTQAGERGVSPTQFHNSVHNAAAGYWSIANASRQPATCLGAHDDTWPATLLTAMVETVSERAPVLLCCYDHPLPPPLDSLRPTGAAFGAGLVLAPMVAGRPSLRVAYSSAPGAAGKPLPPGLDALARCNAAAQALPLLSALARGGAETLAVPYLGGHLSVTVQP